MNLVPEFLIHLFIYSVAPFYLATLKKELQRMYFYIYLSILLTLGGFVGSVYSFPINENIRISGGNLLYGAFMMTSILFVILERDLDVLRKIIRLVITVNIFKFVVFSAYALALDNPAVLNPFDTASGVFSSSVFFLIVGGSLIIFEQFLLILIFERLKKRIENIFNLSFLYTLFFILVLCLDGVLFPMFALGFNPNLAAIVVGNVQGKFIMALSYSLPILLFLFVFRKRLAEYIETPLEIKELFFAYREELIAEIQRQQEEIEVTETRYLESEEKYRRLVDLAQEGIWVIDHDSNTTFVNPSMARILGYDTDEMMGKHLFEFMDEQGIKIATQKLALRRQGIVEQHDFEFIRKDGTRIFVALVTAPMINKEGEYDGAIAGIIDITARKQAEEKLSHYARQLETLQHVTGALATSLSLEAVLALILEQLALVIPSDNTAVFLPENDQMRIVACRGDLETENLIGTLYPIENTLFQEVQTTRKPLFLVDAQSDTRFQNWSRLNKVHGWMGVPLIAHDEMIGHLTLDSYANGTFGEDEANLVVPFAYQAAQAIENARLHEKIQQHADELEERVRERTEQLNSLVNAMAGREVRMAELKTVIKKLQQQIIDAGMTPQASDPLVAE